MNLIKKSLNRTVQSIKEHKLVFVSLIFLIGIIIFLSGFVMMKYSLEIYDDIQGVTVPLAQANYNETALQEGAPFMSDISSMMKSYRLMLQHFQEMFLWLAGIFIFLYGIFWILVHKVVENNRLENKSNHFILKLSLKKYSQQWLKFLVGSALTILPLVVLMYLAFKISFTLGISADSDQFKWIFQISPYLVMLVYYFLLSALAVINVVTWKSFFKKWFEVSIKKVHWTLIILLINLILILVGLSLIYLLMFFESLQSLLLILTPLFLVILVMTAIFWVVGLQELVKEKEEKISEIK